MSEGGAELHTLEEAEPAALEDVQGEQSTEQPEPESSEPKEESARETVTRLYNEAQEKASREESGAPERVRKAERAPDKAAEKPFTIPPPARLTAQQKEAFNALPDPLKKAAHAMFKEHEGRFTRTMQQLQAEQREMQQVREAVRPYLLAHPELSQEGYTESRLVSALIAAHQRLTDPKTAKAAWLELGQNIGISQEALKALSTEGSAGGQVDVTQAPQFKALQEELNRVKSKIDGAEQQQFSATVEGIVSEMEAVRDEKDASGRYVYPELHDADFLTQAKPLVSALVGAMPGLSYGDALRRAYFTLKGNPDNSSRLNQARFSDQDENKNLRAQQAAVSVRGRSAPVAAGDASTVPPEALKSAHDTVRWALQQLRRGA